MTTAIFRRIRRAAIIADRFCPTDGAEFRPAALRAAERAAARSGVHDTRAPLMACHLAGLRGAAHILAPSPACDPIFTGGKALTITGGAIAPLP